MPQTCANIEDVLPVGSEIESLLLRFPDVAALNFLNDEFLIRENEVDQDVYLVVRGSYVVEQIGTDRGCLRPSTLASVSNSPKSPSFVGEMAYLGSCRRTASVRCVGAVVAFHLQPCHLDAIFENYPLLTRLLCRQFTLRLKETSEHLSHLEAKWNLNAQHVFKSAGETVFTKGKPCLTLYQLVDGFLQIEGRPEPVNADAWEGGFVALKEFLLVQPCPFTATAHTPLILVAIEEASRLSFIRHYPQLVLDCLATPPAP